MSSLVQYGKKQVDYLKVNIATGKLAGKTGVKAINDLIMLKRLAVTELNIAKEKKIALIKTIGELQGDYIAVISQSTTTLSCLNNAIIEMDRRIAELLEKRNELDESIACWTWVITAEISALEYYNISHDVEYYEPFGPCIMGDNGLEEKVMCWTFDTQLDLAIPSMVRREQNNQKDQI